MNILSKAIEKEKNIQKIADQFAEFKRKFNRKYASKDEDTKRFEIFQKNVEKITQVNAKKLPYTLGVGPFADLSSGEFRARILGLKPASKTTTASPSKNRAYRESLPDEVDWTAAGYVSDVKNQQACGSCWSFSATGTIESAWAIKRNVTSPIPSLSEQQLLDCSGEEYGNYGCNGGDMRGAFTYLQNVQLSSESAYPYFSVDGYHDGYSCKLVTNSVNDSFSTPQYGIGNWQELEADDKVMQAAVADQPVSIGLCADGDLWQHYSSGVMSGDCCTDVNHGVLVVGYGVDGSLPFYKIKNSWGIEWGEKGYVRLERLDDGVGLCGMLTYGTTISVGTPTCSDNAFCNSKGSSYSPKESEDPMDWACACHCNGYLGPQCEWLCIQDSDCKSQDAPFCDLDGTCVSTAPLPDGCSYVDDAKTPTESVTDAVYCYGPLFCESGADTVSKSVTKLGSQLSLTNFFLSCAGSDQVDTDWINAASSAIAHLKSLKMMDIDLSFTHYIHDSLADFTKTVLNGQSKIENLALRMEMIEMDDNDATDLGEALLSGTSLISLVVDTRLNDIDDGGHLTAVGAGSLVTSLRQLPQLTHLTLGFVQNIDLGKDGAMAIAVALNSGFTSLKSLYLDLEFTFLDCTEEEGDAILAALGNSVNYLSNKSLQTLVLNLGGDNFNDAGSMSLGEALACAVDNGVKLPKFSDTCSCSLDYNEERTCVKLDHGEDNSCLQCPKY